MYILSEINKKIAGARFLGWERKNENSVMIKTDRGTFNINVAGDCCSHSIIYDVVVPEECFGAEIASIDWWDRDNDAVPSEDAVNAKANELCGDQWFVDCLSIWDIKLYTATGTVYVRHVNSSNGYYDGDVYIECNF